MGYWQGKAGLSDAEVARQIGVDPSAVSHWKARRSVPLTKHVLAFAKACGVDMRMFWAPLDLPEHAEG